MKVQPRLCSWTSRVQPVTSQRLYDTVAAQGIKLSVFLGGPERYWVGMNMGPAQVVSAFFLQNLFSVLELCLGRNNTTQYNTTQYNTTQHNAIQHNSRQHNTTQHTTTQRNTIQHNTAQYNSIQHNTTQYNTTQRNAT